MKTPCLIALALLLAAPASAQVMGTGTGPRFGQQFGGRDTHMDEQRCYNRHHPPAERAEACKKLMDEGDIWPQDVADAYRLAGNYDAALAIMTPILAAHPTYAKALEARAVIYATMGKYDLAMADADAAVAATPTDYRAFNARCWVHAATNKDLDTAQNDCAQALMLQHDAADALDTSGFLDFRRGDMKAAITDYDAAIDGDPTVASSRYMRGLAKLRSGDTEGSAADIDRAKDIDPYIGDEFATYGVKP
jgi:tetratricopeptide (TPR) repeat protein